MKKLICILCSLLVICALTACSQVPQSPIQEEKISIIATIFPAYDWAREIIGENDTVDLTLLLDNGVDLHSFQPTVSDMVKISTCDVFIHVGGESDSWVADALKNAVNPDIVVIDLLEILGDAVKEEEIVEGMEHDHEEDEHHDDEHEDDDHHDDDESHAIDEHVWLSLNNAKTMVEYLSNQFQALDAENAQIYARNTTHYLQKLDALDARYRNTVSQAARDNVLFADRFPFRYLTDDYGLHYYAAFAGCAAETEASFETVVFLANKVDELELPWLLTLEGSRHDLADTVISSTIAQNAKVLSMDSMQSVTAKDVAEGASYLSIMEKNLDALNTALN